MTKALRALWVHQNFPAQFGHVAEYLARTGRWDCSFVSRNGKPRPGTLTKHIPYKPRAAPGPGVHEAARSFEACVWNAAGVADAVAASKQEWDVVIGHSGFGSTVFLRDLGVCGAVVNYFEYYFDPSTFSGATPIGAAPLDAGVRQRRRRRTHNAMTLLDWTNCNAGYVPTEFQFSQFPPEMHSKLRVIRDPVDTDMWHRRASARRVKTELSIPPGNLLVTYAARGFEFMRAFDVFIAAAEIVSKQRHDVTFLIVGMDHEFYGTDTWYTGPLTTKEFVLGNSNMDTARVRWLTPVAPWRLAEFLSAGDVHVYLTQPFVLSWSLLDAMACECCLVSNRCDPVTEFVVDGETALLSDVLSPEGVAQALLRALSLGPDRRRAIGKAARANVMDLNSMESQAEKVEAMLTEVIRRGAEA